MKRVLNIARNELHHLYFSPIAWVFMVVLMMLAGMQYVYTAEATIVGFQRGGFSLLPRGIGSYTGAVTYYAYIHPILKDLYLYLPLITMALISREVSSGTIKLLYSSPVKASEIVLGKFTGMLGFLITCMALILLPVAAYCFILYNPDYSQLAVSFLGLFLVMCVYAAIGLFISALSSYQIVAAIITFVVLAIITKARMYWQDIAVIREITFYLDLDSKSNNLFKGLFNLRDVSYCLIIVGSFLSFTIIRLKSSTVYSSWLTKLSRTAAVIAVAVVLATVTSNPFVNIYADATRDDVHTITPAMQKWLAKLDKGPLEITVFANILNNDIGGYGYLPYDQKESIRRDWEKIVRFKPDTRVQFVYYFDTDSSSTVYKINRGLTLEQIAARTAYAYSMDMADLLSPEQVNKLVDVKKEEYRIFFQLRYQGRTTTMRFFDDNDPTYGHWPGDDHFIAAFNRLLGNPMPKVLCLTDELERGPYSHRLRDYQHFLTSLGFSRSLNNRGFDIDTLSLKNRDIPTDVTTLVIADPRKNFSAESIVKIKDYIARGGNLLITGEPDRKEILDPVLEELGISFRPGLMIQPSEKYASDRIFTDLSDTAQHIAPQFYRIIKDNKEVLGDTAFPVVMDGAGTLQYTPKAGFEYFPLMTTDKASSWNRLASIVEDSLQTQMPLRTDDERGSFTTALLVKRKINGKEQRIIVAGDADYLTRPLSSWRLKALNADFGLWCFNYFTYGEFPANVVWPRPIDNKFSIHLEGFTIQRIIFYYVVPALLAIAGSVVLIRRRRK